MNEMHYYPLYWHILIANILTSKDEVTKWLSTFGNLKAASMDENNHAKPPGGALFKKFKYKKLMMSLPKNQRKTCLAFMAHHHPAYKVCVRMVMILQEEVDNPMVLILCYDSRYITCLL